MGAGTSRSGSAANLNDAGAFVRQQEQKSAAADAGAFVRQQEQKSAAAREKNNTGPTRDTSSSEYFDQDKFNRLKTEIDQQRSRNNTGPTRDTSSSEYFDQDKFNRLKTEIDQQRSRNNTGIAFGPGRSYRGNVALGIGSRNQMRKGN